MVRNMEGQGCLITRNPPEPGGTLTPSRVTTSAITPGNGKVADPGLVAIAPGSGEIIAAPVSVCHQVSTTGVLSPPMTLRYQRQASGLIGSPTVPSSRRLDKSWASGMSRPHFMKVRIIVGAV